MNARLKFWATGFKYIDSESQILCGFEGGGGIPNVSSQDNRGVLKASKNESEFGDLSLDIGEVLDFLQSGFQNSATSKRKPDKNVVVYRSGYCCCPSTV